MSLIQDTSSKTSFSTMRSRNQWLVLTEPQGTSSPQTSGMDMEHVTFLNCSQEINRRSDEYWTMVMEIARLNSVKRIKRCCTIMGRKEGAELSGAQIM